MTIENKKPEIEELNPELFTNKSARKPTTFRGGRNRTRVVH